ncbi:MAG: hypothetical protein V1926_02130 [Candidatus Peregrinibacteria bacterium]
MVRRSNDDDGVIDLSNKQLLKVLLDEIADVRRELKGDIADLDQKLTKRIDGVGHGLSKNIDALSSDFQALRIEVHMNQLTFMKNHEELEQRVVVLEATA